MPHFLEIPVFFGLSIEVYFILLLISIPIFFLCRMFLKNLTTDKKIKYISALVVSIILTPLIYLGLITFVFYFITREPRSNFNKSKWMTEREDRYTMGNNIVQSKILIGKDSIQVLQFLGQPNWKNSTATSWTYNMGMGAGFGFFFNYLAIKFENNKVAKVEHIREKD